MASTSRLQLMWVSAAVIAGLLSAAACAHAQGQPWRHGIIEPKSDAGFQVMAVRGGFAQLGPTLSEGHDEHRGARAAAQLAAARLAAHAVFLQAAATELHHRAQAAGCRGLTMALMTISCAPGAVLGCHQRS